MAPIKRYTFPRAQRLSGDRAFAAVYGSRVRRNVGPIGVFARPNGLEHCRLGLSVPRKVGTAVKRNRIKRLLREAYRLCQHDWARGYDIVVTVRPHEPVTLAEYQRLLFKAMRWVDREWQRRGDA